MHRNHQAAKTHRPSVLGYALIAVFFLLTSRGAVIPTGGVAAQCQRGSLSMPRGIVVDRNGSLLVADWSHHRIVRIDNPTSAPCVMVVAGITGVPGFSGDGRPATQAQLKSPGGVAVDLASDLYIADTFNNRIRRVDLGGTIQTVAGIDFSGCEGDGGPATSASLDGPLSVAVDMLGRILIADTGCDRIRLIDQFGQITTVAGGGSPPTGIGDGGLAPRASLNNPSDVVAGAGDAFFIADTNNHRIRRVENGIINTVAGSAQTGFCGDGRSATSACLNSPRGIALGVARGAALFIADTANHRIRRVALDGTITTVAGSGPIGPGPGGCSGDGGPATQARLNGPWDVAVDLQGNLFISDTGNNRIRWVDTSGIIRTIVGPGPCP